MRKSYSNMIYILLLVILLRTGESLGLNGVNKLEDVETSLLKKTEITSNMRLMREKDQLSEVLAPEATSFLENSKNETNKIETLDNDKKDVEEKNFAKGRLKTKNSSNNDIDWNIKKVVDVQNIYTEENSIPFLMFQFMSSARTYFGNIKEFVQKKVTVNSEKPGIRALWLLIIVCFIIFFCCIGLQVILNLAKKSKLNLNNIKQMENLEYEVGDQENNQNLYRYQQSSFPSK